MVTIEDIKKLIKRKRDMDEEIIKAKSKVAEELKEKYEIAELERKLAEAKRNYEDEYKNKTRTLDRRWSIDRDDIHRKIIEKLKEYNNERWKEFIQLLKSLIEEGWAIKCVIITLPPKKTKRVCVNDPRTVYGDTGRVQSIEIDMDDFKYYITFGNSVIMQKIETYEREKAIVKLVKDKEEKTYMWRKSTITKLNIKNIEEVGGKDGNKNKSV